MSRRDVDLDVDPRSSRTRSSFETPDELFAGPGPSRAALRAVDWAATPLGPVPDWAPDLMCAARTVVCAPSPMVLWWGPQFRQVHNDAMMTALGMHSPAVGRPADQAWPELWAELRPCAAEVLVTGRTRIVDEATLQLPTGPAHWTVAMGPLHDTWHGAGAGGDPDGVLDGVPDDTRDTPRPVAGVLVTAVDLTARVRAVEVERREAAETAANLQLALASNRRIGVAVGILMAHGRITDELAFDLLRRASQRRHRKLRDIADEVILTGVLSE